MRQLIALGAAGVAALVGDVPGAAVAAEPASASADQPARADVCIFDLDRQAFVGCFDDEIEARARSVAAARVGSDGWAGVTGGQVLAIHHEHHHGMGQYLMVTGSCGSTMLLDSPWSQRLSSTTARACTVKHYTGGACDGASEATSPNHITNLGPSLNDNVRCLRYS